LPGIGTAGDILTGVSAGVGAATVAGAILLATTTSTAGPEQDEVQYVVRGGQNAANNFINESGVIIDAQGNLQVSPCRRSQTRASKR
jgi:hypothetical protein